jgi:putative transposase
VGRSVADPGGRFAPDSGAGMRQRSRLDCPPPSDRRSSWVGIPLASEPGRREPRSAPAARRPEDRSAASLWADRSRLLGRRVPRVVALGRCPCDREARDRHCMAPARVCEVLGAQVPAPGSPARCLGGHRADREDGPREPDLESASDRRRAREGLGHDVSKDSVPKYVPGPAGRPGRPPSTTWGTFVRLHLAGTIAIDFLTVPTATFRTLYVFVVLSLERRLLLHVNVTAQPYAGWAAQQMVEAMGPEVQAVRLTRDRDGIYSRTFDKRVGRPGLKTTRIAPRSPWQNGYAERFVGTLRRELLDHVVVLGERHLLRLVREHARYLQPRPSSHEPLRRPLRPSGPWKNLRWGR